MSRCDALLAKASNTPGGLTFSEVCRLAECWGYELKGGKGSHKKYKHPHLRLPQGHAMAVFQNRKGKAKEYQVRQLVEKIDYVRERFPDYNPDDPDTYSA